MDERRSAGSRGRSWLRLALGNLPIGVPINGRKRNYCLHLFDEVLRTNRRTDMIAFQGAKVVIDLTVDQQRLLSYCFSNVLRYYTRSDLGKYIAENARGGGIFVDVGANLGMYSFVAKNFGLQAILVEPDPIHSAFLLANSDIFDGVLPVAFSRVTGRLPLNYQAGNHGATSLIPHTGFIEGEDLVPVTTFSIAASQGHLGRCDRIKLVKIDVEGAEGDAVFGMISFLEQGHRPHIWCEVRGDGSERNGGSFRDVTSVLSRFGYQRYEYVNGRPVSPGETEMAARGVFDLLFLPRGAGSRTNG